MLNIIEQLEAYTDQMPEQLRANIEQAKTELNQLQEDEVEKITDKVVSKPASEQHLNRNSPENLLHSCYDGLDQLSRKEAAPHQLQEAVQEMRYYFSIEEQDGFFP